MWEAQAWPTQAGTEQQGRARGMSEEKPVSVRRPRAVSPGPTWTCISILARAGCTWDSDFCLWQQPARRNTVSEVGDTKADADSVGGPWGGSRPASTSHRGAPVPRQGDGLGCSTEDTEVLINARGGVGA